MFRNFVRSAKCEIEVLCALKAEYDGDQDKSRLSSVCAPRVASWCSKKKPFVKTACKPQGSRPQVQTLRGGPATDQSAHRMKHKLSRPGDGLGLPGHGMPSGTSAQGPGVQQ